MLFSIEKQSAKCAQDIVLLSFFAENGKEMLSMNEVLLYLLKSAKPMVDEADLPRLAEMGIPQWEDWVDSIRAMIITKPGMVRLSSLHFRPVFCFFLKQMAGNALAI